MKFISYGNSSKKSLAFFMFKFNKVVQQHNNGEVESTAFTLFVSPSRGAEPSSESAASLTLDLLHGTVFHTISITSVTLVFSSAASKLNYFVEHTSLVVSAPGRSVNSAIEMTVLLFIIILLLHFLAKQSGLT